MTIEVWLANACADAERRGLVDLTPLLESLAESTKALRGAGWDEAGRSPAAPAPADAQEPAPGGTPR
jgi:hypothetical protein